VIKMALENLVQKEKISGIKKYAEKIDLDIDIESMSSR
jgi:hypothetical protein